MSEANSRATAISRTKKNLTVGPSVAKARFSWHFRQPYLLRSKTSFGFIKCAYLMPASATILLMIVRSSVPVALILASSSQAQGSISVIDRPSVADSCPSSLEQPNIYGIPSTFVLT